MTLVHGNPFPRVDPGYAKSYPAIKVAIAMEVWSWVDKGVAPRTLKQICGWYTIAGDRSSATMHVARA